MIKVLIVEDEQLVARMFQKTLAAEGMEAETCNNGEEGLAKIKSWKPDIVLMDMMMPKMNGIQALEAIKEDQEIQNIPVVMLTNLSGKHDAEKALERGAVDYWVKKDAIPSKFAEKIRAMVGKKTEQAGDAKKAA